MEKQQKLLVGLFGVGIVILLIVSLAILFSTKRKPLPSAIPTPTPKYVRIYPTMPPGETIMITDRRFVPDFIKIKKGTLINFINFSGARVDIEPTDPPSTDVNKLNFGLLSDNKATEMVKLSPGTYNFTNKSKPNEKGVIVVE